MGAENAAHDGIHVWTDMYYVEAVDPETDRSPKARSARSCVTPLWTKLTRRRSCAGIPAT